MSALAIVYRARWDLIQGQEKQKVMQVGKLERDRVHVHLTKKRFHFFTHLYLLLLLFCRTTTTTTTLLRRETKVIEEEGLVVMMADEEEHQHMKKFERYFSGKFFQVAN